MDTFVKFWGTRGSIPTPGSWTRVYGGNTSCVEIRFDETLLICDAGSGIRELGKDLLTRDPRPSVLHLFITHTHWDHIQGFPFFMPAYHKDMDIRVYGNSREDDSRYQLLSGQMNSDYFPVSFRDLGARIDFDYFEGNQKQIQGVLVRTFRLNHPGGCFGYSFEKEGRKIVYATDVELDARPGEVFPADASDEELRHVSDGLVNVAQDADLLIIDAQYDDAEYAVRTGWGHSSCFSATDLAVRAGVKELALFHHDPESTDAHVDDLVKQCAARGSRHDPSLVVFGAREGLELKF